METRKDYNADERREYNRAYRSEGFGREGDRRYYARHKEARNASSRAYYHAHREALAARALVRYYASK